MRPEGPKTAFKKMYRKSEEAGMNLEQMRTFIEIVRQKNLSKSARALYLSQPAVSQQLQRLEKELGCTLIEREKKQFKLTAEGKVFFRYAEYVYQESRNCFSNIARIQKGLLGSLDFISTQIAAEYVLVPILNSFKQDFVFADVKVHIVDEMEQVLEEVEKNDDLVGVVGIVPQDDNNWLGDGSELSASKIGEDEQVFFVYQGHPLASKKQIAVADFVGEPLIVKEIPRYKDFSSIGLDLETYQPLIVMGTTEGVFSAVGARLGIGISSRLSVAQREVLGTVKIIDVKNHSAKRDLYFVYRYSGLTSSLTRNFVSFVMEMQNETSRQI
jgi:DNA-binding transcriptional LysR family regulator